MGESETPSNRDLKKSLNNLCCAQLALIPKIIQQNIKNLRKYKPIKL